jgi:exodeoxyribonuclease-5
MLPNELWKLLLSHKIHIIALGDPFQLPPIGDDNGVLYSPHIFLDEIMRQEKDSEIINLTMKIRNGETLPFYKGEEVQVLPANKLVDGMYLWADQILCGKNVTRHKINSEMRQLKFNIDNNDPIDGDKVICLHNDWQIARTQGNVLVNGEMGILHNVKIRNMPFIDKVVISDFELEDQSADFTQLKMDYKIFNEGEPTINKDNFAKIPKIFHPHQFDYGYCITVHKAQGDEFDKVLVIEEFLKSSEHARWLYTACTRAAKKLVVIKRG